MQEPENLMSFLASAARHTPVNQDILTETARQEQAEIVRQQIQEAREREEEAERQRQELLRQQAETQALQQQLDEDEREELRQQALQNLGIGAEGSTGEEENPMNLGVGMASAEVVEHFISTEGDSKEEPEEEKVREPQDDDPLFIPKQMTVREELVRFSDAVWFNKVQEKIIVLAGVGGIGSNMAVILAKLNPSAIYMFDDDVVDASNMAGQFYSNADIGKPKVEALASSVTKYTNYSSVFAINRKYLPGEEIVSDIMICGFDNMTARKTYFNAWKAHVKATPEAERANCLFIDGRLTADEFQIFCMTGEDTYYMEDYERNYLFKDYEANNLACSYKQTGYLADMIGAYMVNLLVNFCANQVCPARNMTLPFMTSYRSSMMFLDFKR